MKRELRDKWVAALRSGEYKRTIGQLYRNDPDNRDDKNGYCCLGVLAVCAGLPLGDGTTDDPPDTIDAVYGHEYRKTDLGLENDTATQLFRFNDRSSTTFKQVADLIEEIVPVED